MPFAGNNLAATPMFITAWIPNIETRPVPAKRTKISRSRSSRANETHTIEAYIVKISPTRTNPYSSAATAMIKSV